MNAPRFFLFASIVSTLLVLNMQMACASDETAKRTDTSGGSEVRGPDRLADDTFDVGCCTKREFDLNKDNRPDSYTFATVVDGETRILRKENDINFDGKIDLVRTLNERGELVEERLDTDFDARVDVVIFFERGKVVRKERDTNFDSKVDMWVFFDKDAMTREEADLNYDGKVDYWEYFEGGKLDRVGIDRDHDGNVDEWIQSAADG